jgi:hypothetical protein
LIYREMCRTSRKAGKEEKGRESLAAGVSGCFRACAVREVLQCLVV